MPATVLARDDGNFAGHLRVKRETSVVITFVLQPRPSAGFLFYTSYATWFRLQRSGSGRHPVAAVHRIKTPYSTQHQ